MASSTSTKDYKKMASKFQKENKTLKTQLEDIKTQHAEERATAKKVMEDFKTKMKKEHQQWKLAHDEMTKERDEALAKVEEAEVFCQSLVELTGKSTAEEVFQWAEEKANEDQAEKTQQDALRMLGELQVKFNLLTEQMERIKKEGYKVSKPTKNQKGHSGTHRKEKVSQGVLECFHKNRCCAMVWADGLGQQCSRHWDKHKDGPDSRLCKTHYNHYDPATHEYTGAHGLYHINRPQKWGDYGLSVQTGTYKVGGNICWKLKQAEYDTQFKSQEFQDSIPDDLPKYCYPDVVFHEEDDDDQSDTISAISGSTQAFSEDNDVANLDDVAEADEVQVEEDPVAFAKQAQLDRLEQLNQGAIAVDYDILCDLREEKKQWEEEQAQSDGELQEDTNEIASEEDEMIECFACDKQIKKGSGHFPCEPDEEYCFECARQVEYDQQNSHMANQLADSDEEQ